MAQWRNEHKMTKVENESKVNEVQDPILLLKKYQREVKELKQELNMHDTLAHKGNVNYDPYTPEQQYDIQQIAESFLTGKMENIDELSSMR